LTLENLANGQRRWSEGRFASDKRSAVGIETPGRLADVHLIAVGPE
jgi:hypothetical protein